MFYKECQKSYSSGVTKDIFHPTCFPLQFGPALQQRLHVPFASMGYYIFIYFDIPRVVTDPFDESVPQAFNRQLRAVSKGEIKMHIVSLLTLMTSDK